MIQDLHEAFERNNDEFLKFDRITEPLHSKPDIAGMLLLASLDSNFPGDFICDARHEEIFFGASPEAVAAVATEEDIQNLLRCGVRFSASEDCFCMFA